MCTLKIPIAVIKIIDKYKKKLPLEGERVQGKGL
jgi:hypothetical protein